MITICYRNVLVEKGFQKAEFVIIILLISMNGNIFF